MKKNASLKKWDQRFIQLTKKLGEIGYILPGSIHKRIIKVENPQGMGKKKERGPCHSGQPPFSQI